MRTTTDLDPWLQQAIGGSDAQRDVVDLTVAQAAVMAGKDALSAALFAER